MRYLLVFLAILGSACTSSKDAIPSSVPNVNWAQEIDKAANFYRLDPHFYRSLQLSAKDAPLLKANGIKTIINLRFFDRNDDEQAFGDRTFRLINTPLMSWAISPQDVAFVLWEVEKAQQDGTVLVHCYHGADRTGLISAMYRILYQNWSVDAAKEEMRHGPYGFHSIWKNIENFLTPDNVAEVKAELAKLREKR